jgi:hypothetical protein
MRDDDLRILASVSHVTTEHLVQHLLVPAQKSAEALCQEHLL